MFSLADHLRFSRLFDQKRQMAQLDDGSWNDATMAALCAEINLRPQYDWRPVLLSVFNCHYRDVFVAMEYFMRGANPTEIWITLLDEHGLLTWSQVLEDFTNHLYNTDWRLIRVYTLEKGPSAGFLYMKVAGHCKNQKTKLRRLCDRYRSTHLPLDDKTQPPSDLNSAMLAENSDAGSEVADPRLSAEDEGRYAEEVIAESEMFHRLLNTLLTADELECVLLLHGLQGRKKRTQAEIVDALPWTGKGNPKKVSELVAHASYKLGVAAFLAGQRLGMGFLQHPDAHPVAADHVGLLMLDVAALEGSGSASIYALTASVVCEDLSSRNQVWQPVSLHTTAEITEGAWDTVFAHLRERGLRGVQLLIAYEYPGLAGAVARHLPGVYWQSCHMRLKHDIWRRAPFEQRSSIAPLLSSVLSQADYQAAESKLARILGEVSIRRQNADLLDNEFRERLVRCFTIHPLVDRRYHERLSTTWDTLALPRLNLQRNALGSLVNLSDPYQEDYAGYMAMMMRKYHAIFFTNPAAALEEEALSRTVSAMLRSYEWVRQECLRQPYLRNETLASLMTLPTTWLQ